MDIQTNHCLPLATLSPALRLDVVPPVYRFLLPLVLPPSIPARQSTRF
jgi:hypothetical protein